MPVLSYACAVEIEPGVTVPLDQCTTTDLAAARVLEARKAALHAQIELLLTGAAKNDLLIPDGLRERISLWSGDLIELESLRYELEDELLAPV